MTLEIELGRGGRHLSQERSSVPWTSWVEQVVPSLRSNDCLTKVLEPRVVEQLAETRTGPKRFSALRNHRLLQSAGKRCATQNQIQPLALGFYLVGLDSS